MKTMKNDNESPLPNGGINVNVVTGSNQSTQPNYVVGKTAVNKAVYCLLAFFLGSFGIHKFYSGKTGLGIVYILFSWTGIPFIISVIEFIIALCMKSDANGNILI